MDKESKRDLLAAVYLMLFAVTWVLALIAGSQVFGEGDKSWHAICLFIASFITALFYLAKIAIWKSHVRWGHYGGEI